MKIKARSDRVRVPPVGQWIGARIDAQGVSYVLQMVEIEHILQRRQADGPENFGVPRSFVHDVGRSEVLFYPTPSTDCEVRFSFYPPPVEI